MLKKTGFMLGMLILFSGLLIGCSPEKAPEENGSGDTASFTGEYIIDKAYLEGKIDSDDVIILDARGEEEAKKGTIKNAQAVMWQQFSKMDGESKDEGWGNLLSKDAMEKALSAAGLSKDKEIIAFADGGNGWGEDGRILWTLKSCGYTNIKMLDGGYTYWKENGGATTTEVKAPTATPITIDGISDTWLITEDQLAAGIDSIKIVDTRLVDEYVGAVKYGESRGGHIKNAVNIPFTELFNENNTLKSNDEIKKMFTDKGVETKDEVALYCTAGIRSGYATIILDMLGYKDAKNYDGSIYEWSANESNLMEK